MSQPGGPSQGYLSRGPWLSFAFDDNSILIEGNQAVSQLIGVSQAQLPGLPVSQLLTKSGQIFYQTHLFPLLRVAGRADEVFLLFRNQQGEALPVLAYGVRWQHEDRWINECHCAPIPQRRLLERELIQARQKAEETIRQNLALNQAKQALELHQAELDKRIHQLERANDELGQIAKIVSHDLQEPLRKISILTDLLINSPSALSPAHKPLLDQIDSICQSTTRLISGLRNYIGLDNQLGSVEEIELETLIQEAAREASQANQYSDGWLISSGIPTMTGYRQQIGQLFFHIFDNALKFRKPDQVLRVQLTADIIQENKYVSIQGKYQYTDHVRICIQDNGIGFLPRYRQDIFLLLKRLVKTNQTLGLGLALSKKIVANHYGTISADSLPGQGTTITLVFPRLQ